MGAFAEARYFAWDRLKAEQQFPVKAYSLRAEQILGNAQRARPFIGGPVLLVRLAPVDYHRFGGSAIVVFGEPGMWRPSGDLLEHTKEGVETLVRLGEPVGLQSSSPDGVKTAK
jgi:hypothetical protein